LERAELEMAIFQHGQSLMAKVPLIADAKQKALAERQLRFEMQRLYERTFIEAERYRSECKRYVQKSLDKMHEVASRRRVEPRGSTITESYPSTGYKTFTWRPDYDADDPSQGNALDFGSELCSPRVTTFAERSSEKP